MLITFLVLGMGLWCLILLIRDARALRHIPRLDAHELQTTPYIDVIIPARNEERNIEQVVRGILAQNYPHFSVTVIDDHSTDRTTAILSSIDDERLRVVQSAELPTGWKGKCWACWQGAQATEGEWLLFLDADTRPQAGLIEQTLAYSQQHNLDLLSMMPFVELGSFWERTIMPAFFSMIQAAFPFQKVNHPDSDIILANGQFILVRRAAYEQGGGHRAVYNRVLEDVELAQTIVKHGGRMQVIDGREVLRVRMYTNGAEVWEGLTKNAIAGLRNGGIRSSWAGIRQLVVALVPPSLLLGAGWVNLRRWPRWQRRIINLTTMLVVGFAGWSWGTFMRKLYNLPRWRAIFFPLGLACYMLIAAQAAWKIWRGIGITWKGRNYTD